MHGLDATSEPTGRIADRLAAVRRARFVGRMKEVEGFRAALLAGEPPFVVLYVHGPGGVGKSTLLREFARVTEAANRPAVLVDGRDADPTPEGFLAALRAALGLRGVDSEPSPAVPDLPPDVALLIDTYELLAPLDAWLRETFLPGLPARTLVAIAGRNPPAPAWRTDLAWAGLTRVVPLGNFLPEESLTYLAARGIPAERQAEALAFTHGHPLALALAADLLQQEAGTADLREQPDVVRVLVERLVREVPSVEHRLALEACALARATTESLLAEVLRVPDAHDLFSWLRGLPGIEQGPHGLYPHDLAREALVADLGWRDPETCHKLSGRIFYSIFRRMESAPHLERHRLRMDALFAVRTRPAMDGYFDWNAGGVYAGSVEPADVAPIRGMVARHEGQESAAIVDYWLARQPEAFLVYRRTDGERFGFLALLSLRQVRPDDLAVDPALGPALALAERYGPAAGDDILYLRYWMHQEHYQAVTPAINLAATTILGRCLSHPRLAWNFIAMADPAFWQGHFNGVNFPRAQEADFEVGGHRYGVFAHDWRVETAQEWLSGRYKPMPFDASRAIDEPLRQSLSRAAFDEALRQALRDYTRPDRLAGNPLMTSRLVPAGGTDPAALQAALREVVATLAVSPRDVKFHRALWHTYIEPAPTQERAAELLGLPFNTYRYHLSTGLERLADALWQWERDPSR